MKNIIIIIALAWTFTASAQSKITANEAHKQLSINNKIQLVDVRTDEEYSSKHIQNSIHIDWSNQKSFDTQVAKLNKKNPVYVYCLSGGRSAKAAKKLVDQGFTVFEIDGGIMKWEYNDLPLVKQSTALQSLSKQQFEDITKSNKIVLIDFYATWCGPCKKMAPGIENIKTNFADRVKVIKIDVDQNSDLVKSLNITSIPTVYIYKNGKLSWKNTGFADQKTIEQHL